MRRGIFFILAGILLMPGCAMLPASQAQMRTKVRSELHPAQAYQVLVQFHSATLQQFVAGGMEAEKLAIIVSWIARLDTVLTGPHPEAFEATAREVWPVVRSILGPYDSLQPFAARFDELLQ